MRRRIRAIRRRRLSSPVLQRQLTPARGKLDTASRPANDPPRLTEKHAIGSPPKIGLGQGDTFVPPLLASGPSYTPVAMFHALVESAFFSASNRPLGERSTASRPVGCESRSRSGQNTLTHPTPCLSV